jgi:hypothetical protein
VSGLDNLIVGYPEGDPRIALLWEEHGHRAVPHRGCLNCGVICYFVPSGVDAIRSRDPEVVCERCWQRPDVKRDLYAAL